MTEQVATIDFHVTSECNMECPYCWGPQGFEHPVDTATARRIISRIKEVGARRIVFTGGDPLKRQDAGALIQHAQEIGLEVALSTTGDELTAAFLDEFGRYIDLISLPLDGSTEEVNKRTKKEEHFATIIRDLEWLRQHPAIDVKICTPVTRHNLADVPNIARLADDYAQSTAAKVFYNVFQAFPRSMQPREWAELLVTAEEFVALQRQIASQVSLSVNFLSQATLDRLYVMIFPDGSLVIPSGPDFVTYGPFLEIADFTAVVAASQFDAAKHLRHSRWWESMTKDR